LSARADNPVLARLNAQRQSDALHDGAGNQQDLMPAGPALEQWVGSTTLPSASGPLQRGQRNPIGQRACPKATAHCASLPVRLTNSGIDSPG
jgi:hypothetical protein